MEAEVCSYWIDRLRSVFAGRGYRLSRPDAIGRGAEDDGVVSRLRRCRRIVAKHPGSSVGVGPGPRPSSVPTPIGVSATWPHGSMASRHLTPSRPVPSASPSSSLGPAPGSSRTCDRTVRALGSRSAFGWAKMKVRSACHAGGVAPSPPERQPGISSRRRPLALAPGRDFRRTRTPTRSSIAPILHCPGTPLLQRGGALTASNKTS
jgi:hypothetical protein